MRRRPRLGTFGLRGRIVGLVLVTTVATLAVAAVTLLGPLESSLQRAARNTLRGELCGAGRRCNEHITRPFADIDPSLILNARVVGNSGADVRLRDQGNDVIRHVQQLLSAVGSQVEAKEVTLIGSFNAAGNGLVMQTWPPYLAASGSFGDAATAFETHSPQFSLGTLQGSDYVGAALPFRAGDGKWWVLAIRKRIDEIPAAVSAVARAFLTAALAGLALALILGIPLSATLVRRLRRLRQTAVRVAREGPRIEVPADRARDEVGDLARTFAIMQRQLRRQEEARRAFVATASHELRTPLTSLDGMLELLDDDLRSGETDLEESHALLARARAQSRRLGRLAADLLDLSRLDAEIELRSEPIELGELCRAVLAEFELASGEQGISSTLEAGEQSVWALGDPGSVARIVRILLDNAMRVSPTGSEVKVSIESGSPVLLSVCDQGPGVPPGDRAIIFQRFQRGRTTAGEAGFGLGLAIGRELAERMGGELLLDPAYGPGAKFTLRLPTARAPYARPLAVR